MGSSLASKLQLEEERACCVYFCPGIKRLLVVVPFFALFILLLLLLCALSLLPASHQNIKIIEIEQSPGRCAFGDWRLETATGASDDRVMTEIHTYIIYYIYILIIYVSRLYSI